MQKALPHVVSETLRLGSGVHPRSHPAEEHQTASPKVTEERQQSASRNFFASEIRQML